jgi:glutathione S-transferase
VLEERLGDGREYLAGGFSLADVAAHTGNFVRLRELAEGGRSS